MKTAGWVLAVVVAMAAVLGGFWYGMVHAKRPPVPAPAGMAPAPPPIKTAEQMQGGPLSEARQRMFAAVACGQAVKLGTKGTISCPVCPAWSEDAGTTASPTDPTGAWTYGSMIFGHFTAAAAAEALLRVDGCESHAMSFGGDFLLRQDAAGAWQRVRYIEGGMADEDCQRLHWIGGRDALVCPTGDMHQGIEESAALLLTVEPTAQEPSDGSHVDFLMLSDDSGDCTPEDHPATVQNASIDKINVLPAGPDGRQDVEILASVGRTAVKPTDTDCPDAPEKKYRLLFRNKGDHFEVADGAAAIKALAGKDGDTGEVVLSDVVRPFAY